MSVFELSSLPKLRRIGLVRVSNLTDEAIYALAERHSTLERIHLSYCDQISVMAIHFLLQKLHKLTHLSLTGIPSFRKHELQQFCRPPPQVSHADSTSNQRLTVLQEFNMSQRMAFCVYSGSGVAKLRGFLTDLFNTITEDMNADDDETEYDDDFDEGFVEGALDADMEGGMDGDLDEDFMRDGRYHFNTPQPAPSTLRGSRPDFIAPVSQHPELAMQRDVTLRPGHASFAPAPATFSPHIQPPPLNPQLIAGPSNPALRRPRGFGYQPVIEASTSPSQSDVSNRSAGTAQSSGAGFFRTYQESASARSNGALTPDYNFAELGHGRGTEHNAIDHVTPLPHQLARHSFTSPTSFNAAAGPSTQGIAQVMHSANFDFSHEQNPERHDLGTNRTDTANSYFIAPVAVSNDHLVPWPPMRTEPLYDMTSSSSQDLHDSVQATFSHSTEAHETGGRGRSVRRSLRNTFHAAEHFFFGRGSTSNGQASEPNIQNPWAQGNVNNTGDGGSGQPR